MSLCRGVVINTGQLNKLKLVFQLIATMTGLAWEAFTSLLRPLTWIALGLALVTGVWSMLALFRENRDLWRRKPLKMGRR